MKKRLLLMGNEAIAYGAMEAGVEVATAYPGTPSSEVLMTLAKHAGETGAYIEWSVNEKVALEVAAGAAYAGLRSLVAMKQVGLNVAADPLMSLSYIGVKGGMVVVVADDPGPHSSQTEQDTRLFAKFAKLPVLDPATPAEARKMAIEAFSLSERLGVPVILRPTTRVSHVSQDVEVGEIRTVERNGRFEKSPDWVIFPSLAYRKHQHLEKLQEEMRQTFASLPFNRVWRSGSGSTGCGVICSGVSFSYVQEAISLLGLDLEVLKIGTPQPLPDQLVAEFLKDKKVVVVIEELDPVVEEQVIQVAWKEGLPTAIRGKHDGTVPRAGELNVDLVKKVLLKALPLKTQEASETRVEEAEQPPQQAPTPKLPQRSPVLCAGCPHRASFYAVKEATKGMDAVYTGDIGCYTLGVMPPLKMVDTCLCMGASIGIASGLCRAEQDRLHIAFLGDSTFFHTGVPALINAVYNRARFLLVILDNSTTAMTGFQPHPGTGETATGEETQKIDLAAVCRGCGVKWVKEVDPYDLKAAMAAVKEAVSLNEPAVLIMRRECVQLQKKMRQFQVDHDLCVGCETCLELGCPAIVKNGETVEITGTCSGCGVCAQICPAEAITEKATRP